MANEYDIYKILEEMELELTKLYSASISKGIAADVDSWKSMQLQNLKKFHKQSREIIAHYQKLVDGTAKESVLEMYRAGKIQTFERLAPSGASEPTVINISNKRMLRLLNAVHHDMSNACVSAFRKINDIYRENIFRAAVNFNSGTLTMRQAIDMASKQFLDKGINSIVYKNGQEHDICSYSEMAIRTNGTRAQLMGGSEQAREYGVNTCYISTHGITCDACAEYQGQWYIDDVFNDYTGDGHEDYPFLSEAVEGGLFHPNCRHHVIYGDPDGAKNKQRERTDVDREKYDNQQQQRKLERDIRKAKRTEAGSVDPEAKAAAHKQVKEAQKKMRDFLDDKPYLVRQRDRETDAVIKS